MSQIGAVRTLQALRGLGEPRLLPHFDSLPANAGSGWEFEFGDYPPDDPATGITPNAPLVSAIRQENIVIPIKPDLTPAHKGRTWTDIHGRLIDPDNPPPPPVKKGAATLAQLIAASKAKKG